VTLEFKYNLVEYTDHPDAELIAEAQKIVDTFQENYSASGRNCYKQ
jgi:hypothetical protein